MVRWTMMAAGCAAAIVAAPAQSQSTADVRCLILSNAFAKAGGTAQMKRAAEFSALYYLGRIDTRLNDAQLRAAVTEQQKNIKLASAGTEMQACARRVQASTRRLQNNAAPATSPPRRGNSPNGGARRG